MTLNPETINEWKMKEIIEADKWRNAQKMLGLLTPETINEWKQKAEQYDALGGKDYVLMHKDEVKELKEKASGLYKCSQCPQWEKAEKWDRKAMKGHIRSIRLGDGLDDPFFTYQQGNMSKGKLIEIIIDSLEEYFAIGGLQNKLDLIFQGLEVKEKCQCDKGYLWDNPNYFGQKRICHFCHGTGFITRPPTGEEVREFLEWLFSSIRTRHDFYQFLMHRTFTLKSGAILRMKEEYDTKS